MSGILRANGFNTAVVDLENTLVPYGPARSAVELEAEMADLPGGILKAVIVSNARWTRNLDHLGRWPVVGLARKPFTSLDRIASALEGSRIDVVIGDQYLTDGLLAWRLNVPFIQVHRPAGREPLWPRLMRLMGGVVAASLSVSAAVISRIRGQRR